MGYKFINEKGEHCHTLDGKPLIGCTTALDVLGTPLTWWASGMAMRGMGWKPLNRDDDNKIIPYKETNKIKERREVCFIHSSKRLEEIKRMSDEEYFNLLQECYQAHNKKFREAGQEGTDAHDYCEEYIKSVIKGIPIVHHPSIDSFVKWSKVNVKRFLWSELHLYNRELWIGGISDIGYEDINGNYGIGDFKNRKKGYPKDLFQCGGYNLMIDGNKEGYDSEGNVKYILDKPIKFHAVFPLVDFVEPDISFDVYNNRVTYGNILQIYRAIQTIEGRYKNE